MIGILPTLSAGHMSPASLSPNPRYQLLSDQILAARGEDIVIDIGGPERLRTTSDSIVPEAACTSTQLHIQVSPEDFPAYWNASQAIAGVQLALGANSPFLLGTRAVAGDPDRAVRAGHRHPQRGAQGAGRAPAGVVRRALDQLDLRPVRGERPLLPGAAADHRRRGPARACSRRGDPDACRAAAAQRHDLPLEPAGVRRRRRHPAPAGREPGAARPGRPSRTRWPTPPSTSVWCARSPSTSGRCGRRCRSAPPRRTSTSRARQGIEANVYWPGLGQVPATELVLRRLLPMARAGLDAWGVHAGGERPAARHHRAALPDRAERRLVVRRPVPRAQPARATATGSTRCARRSTSTARTCTPTSPCTPGSEVSASAAAAASRPGSRR